MEDKKKYESDDIIDSKIQKKIRKKPVVKEFKLEDSQIIESNNKLALEDIKEVKRKKPQVKLFESDIKETQIKELNRSKLPLEDIQEDIQEDIIELNENEKNINCKTLYDPCTKEELLKIEPVSGKTDYDIKQLEKRVREIKKMRDKTASGLYGLSNETSNYDFLMNVFCDKTILLDDMVNFRLQDGGQIGSDIYEVLCRLFVVFGGIKEVELKENYKFMMKIEDASSVIDNVENALKIMKCKATNKMGVSDITLIKIKSKDKIIKPDSSYCEVECDMEEDEEIRTYLMSVKWYKDEKSGEHYDLEKLYLAGNKLISEEKKPFSIIVFLKSKLDFQKAHNRSYRQYVSSIPKTFFGWNEDVKPFLEDIRKTLFENSSILNKTPQELIRTQYLSSGSKPILSLQLHQDLIVTKINDLLEEDRYNDKKYVIGVLPRGGKTFIAGGIIREYFKRNHLEDKKVNILWITAAPNETLSQVSNELILKFQDFDNFDFINVKNGKELLTNHMKRHTMIFTSIQLLTTMQRGKARERILLEKLLDGKDINNKINIIFFDEAHAGGSGEQSKIVIQNLMNRYENTIPMIYLTATYLKIIESYKIISNNLLVWDYTDVLRTRAIVAESEREDSIKNLNNRFGRETVDKVIGRRLENKESYEAMGKPYLEFPELFFISAQFNEHAIKRFSEQNLYDSRRGFSLGGIFGLRLDQSRFSVRTINNKVRKDAYRIFENLEGVKDLISLITPTDPTESFEFKSNGGLPFLVDDTEYDQTILKRIDRISKDTKSRFRLDEYPTLLMFLPTGGIGSDINKKLPAFGSLLMNHKWWKKRYEVACVISRETDTIYENEMKAELIEEAPELDSVHIITDNLKSEIIKLERELQCTKKKGLVILAGERLSMGISLPCTDVVFLLNETKSPDDIIQKMYRALTPSKDKKSSFVVDLNPVRTLSATYGYTKAAYQSAITQSSILDIIYDVYSWDYDYFQYNIQKGKESRILSAQDRLKELLEEASRDDQYNIFKNIGEYETKLRKNIEKKIKEDELIYLLKDMMIPKLMSPDKKITFKNQANFIVKDGKIVMKIKKENNDKEENNDKKEEDKDVEIIIIDNFIESLKDFIKYIAITSTKNNLEEALIELEKNEVNNTGSTLKLDLYRLLKNRGAIQDGILNPDNIMKIFLTAVKEYSPDSSRELYRQMKSKIEEQSTRKNEVLKIIHRHLTPRQKQKKDFGEVFTPIELIESMLSHLPKSDWEDPSLIWLDPANGIGNFPIVIFYKLNEGLKKHIPNENKRKKHIIEKMLFMMELQSNNTRISKNIFEKLCEGCKPNIWTVDTLKKSKEEILQHFGIDKIDRIVGNPPFQAYQESNEKRGGGDELYMKFTRKAIELLDSNGYLVFVHPSSWRKPEFTEDRKKSKNAGMFKLMTHDNQLHYLEIHSSKDGLAKFKASTRYDFYLLQKTPSHQKTLIKDELGKEIELSLKKYNFLPNYNIKQVMELVALDDDKKCNINTCILYERSAYGSDKDWVSDKKTDKYKYPLIHSTPKDGIRYMYSSTKDNGFFGISKVIFGESGIYNPIIDDEGKYGMTQGAMAIVISSKKEGTVLAKFLESDLFKMNILSPCMWGNFRIDWRLFTTFKNKFWNIKLNNEQQIKINHEEKNEEKKGGSRRFSNTRKK